MCFPLDYEMRWSHWIFKYELYHANYFECLSNAKHYPKCKGDDLSGNILKAWHIEFENPCKMSWRAPIAISDGILQGSSPVYHKSYGMINQQKGLKT